jgi:hypothetical protein
VEEGLTHQQIAERVFTTTGNPVSRSTVSAALHRAGISSTTTRYREELPWRVKMDHITEYPARMLRLLGRRRSGGSLNEDEDKRLDSWLAHLDAEHAVVAYDPTSQYGFYYVERDDNVDLPGLPIRRQTVTIDG